MKLVYVCSPLSGDIEGNMAKARVYCRWVKDNGHIPFAPHLLFPQFMDDNNQNDRELAMRMNMEMLDKCDELWVFHQNGISCGMLAEIGHAEKMAKVIKYIEFVKTNE